MTSSINPNNIDGNYPTAGVPNNTQGFRDNFTNTKTNFQYAADEISDLQSKAVLKSALTGTTLDNDMNDNAIYAVELRDVSYAYLPLTATSGSIDIDYSAAPFQQINLTGPISLNFTNWPISGKAGTVRVGFNITNTAYTVTLPAAVTQGVGTIAGISPGTPGVTNTITFGNVGNYAFEFVTIDSGTNIWIFDDSRAPGKIATTLNITNTTASTSKTTGALVVAGGVGIGGNLNVGGNLKTYTSTGNVSLQALDNGFLQINAPTVAGNTAGAFSIIGSANAVYQNVTSSGCMIHVTGNDGVSSRIVNDAYGTGAIPTFTTRAARGTATAPTAIQSGDVIARFGFVGWDGTDFGAPGGAGTGVDVVAIENFTDSAQGTNIKLYTSPATANTKVLSMTVASNVVTFPANVSVTGSGGVALTDGGTVGYGVGAGGTIAQAGNKSGGVTLNKPSGEITMQNTSLGAATVVSFVLTNSTIANTDVLVINHVSGGTIGAYTFTASCNTGNATIYVRNNTAAPLSEALVLRYVVIKGSTT